MSTDKNRIQAYITDTLNDELTRYCLDNGNITKSKAIEIILAKFFTTDANPNPTKSIETGTVKKSELEIVQNQVESLSELVSNLLERIAHLESLSQVPSELPDELLDESLSELPDELLDESLSELPDELPNDVPSELPDELPNELLDESLSELPDDDNKPWYSLTEVAKAIGFSKSTVSTRIKRQLDNGIEKPTIDSCKSIFQLFDCTAKPYKFVRLA